MSIHSTARVIRHPGSYLAAGAIHSGAGLVNILLKMTIVWPLLMCWYLVYGMFYLMWIVAKGIRDGRRPATQEQILAEHARVNHQHMAARRAAEAQQPRGPFFS